MFRVVIRVIRPLFNFDQRRVLELGRIRAGASSYRVRFT